MVSDIMLQLLHDADQKLTCACGPAAEKTLLFNERHHDVITTSSQRHHTPYSEESEWLVLFGASISANVYKNLREYK